MQTSGELLLLLHKVGGLTTQEYSSARSVVPAGAAQYGGHRASSSAQYGGYGPSPPAGSTVAHPAYDSRTGQWYITHSPSYGPSDGWHSAWRHVAGAQRMRKGAGGGGGSSRESVRVMVRIRGGKGPATAMEVEGGQRITLLPRPQDGRAPDPYDFDAVFDTDSKQADLHEKIGKPTVTNLLDGKNGTIFAYGQTASGKTYSMMGPGGTPEENAQCLQPGSDMYEHRGLIPRIIEDLFAGLQEQQGTGGKVKNLQLGVFEIYMEKLTDLNPEDGRVREGKVKIVVDKANRADPIKMVGLHWKQVTSAEACALEMIRCLSNRQMAATSYNNRSSRSHTVVKIRRNDSKGNTVCSLNLVDLAGSEAVGKRGAEGTSREEGIKINQSLGALQKVIKILSSGKSTYINWRGSQLTRCLQQALTSNCITNLLCAVHPGHEEIHKETGDTLEYYGMTKGTLRFGSGAKKISMTVTANTGDLSTKELELKVAQLERENEELRMEVHNLKEAAEFNKGMERSETGRMASSMNVGAGPGQVVISEEEKQANEEAIARLRGSVDESKAAVSRAQAELAQAEQEAKELRGRVASAEGQLSALSGARDAAKAAAAAAAEVSSRFQRQLDDAASKAELKSQEIQALTGKVAASAAAAVRAKSEAKAQGAAWEKEKVAMTQRECTLADRINSLDEQLQQGKQMLDERQHLVEDAEAAAVEKDEKIDRQLERIRELEEQLAAMLSARDKLEGEMQSQKETFKKNLATLSGSSDETQQDLIECREMLELSELAIAQKEAEKEQMQKELQAAHGEALAQRDERIQHFEALYNNAAERAEEAEHAQQQQDTRVAELEKALAAANETIAERDARIEELMGQFISITDDLIQMLPTMSLGRQDRDTLIDFGQRIRGMGGAEDEGDAGDLKKMAAKLYNAEGQHEYMNMMDIVHMTWSSDLDDIKRAVGRQDKSMPGWASIYRQSVTSAQEKVTGVIQILVGKTFFEMEDEARREEMVEKMESMKDGFAAIIQQLDEGRRSKPAAPWQPLISMGYGEQQARRAYDRANGDLRMATNILLGISSGLSGARPEERL